MASKLRTDVSKAYCCNPSHQYSFEEAQTGDRSTEKLVWLDQLFHGGIVLPDETEGRRAVTILLTGPPGTGKSTLAMELASRWSSKSMWPEGVLDRTPRVLYVTTEAPPNWLVANARTHGWKFKSTIAPIALRSRNVAGGQVTVMGCEASVLAKEAETSNTLQGTLKTIFSVLRRDEERDENLKLDVDALFIDSLNTFQTPQERGQAFAALSDLASSGSRVIVMVLDSSPTAKTKDVWEFASDIVIRLDRNYGRADNENYMIRTIEILKARYQVHVLGKHQLKIQEAISEEEMGRMNFSARMRAHPYRREGGVVIFPSIHYVLSRHKRTSPTENKKEDVDPSHVANLDALLGGGYPKGRCTALVGQRGGHKSHLGYREILGRIGRNFDQPKSQRRNHRQEKALIVSLRDDEGMVRQTLEKILVNTDENLRKLEPSKAMKEAKERLAKYESTDLLEIAYYPPGYITPEEFFHRLMLSTRRLKGDNAHVTLLFNSLDQLSSRFPLCAHEPIFIPGIIQMLTAEHVSSFFVTARDGASNESYGLDTMAELILDFTRRQMKWTEFLPYLKAAFGEKVDSWTGKPLSEDWQRQAVIVSIGRYAGGQAAGAEGVLEFLDAKNWLEELCPERDLYFLPPHL